MLENCQEWRSWIRCKFHQAKKSKINAPREICKYAHREKWKDLQAFFVLSSKRRKSSFNSKQFFLELDHFFCLLLFSECIHSFPWAHKQKNNTEPLSTKKHTAVFDVVARARGGDAKAQLEEENSFSRLSRLVINYNNEMEHGIACLKKLLSLRSFAIFLLFFSLHSLMPGLIACIVCCWKLKLFWLFFRWWRRIGEHTAEWV